MAREAARNGANSGRSAGAAIEPRNRAARGRPAAREPLSADRIRAAALELADAHGVEALSMRRLAAALQVDPMSIYHHVPNKRALLQAVYQRVLEQLPIPRAGAGPWQDELRELARRFHALARRHPRVVPALFASPYGTPREREVYAAIDRILGRIGFGADDRVELARAIFTYASGLAAVAASGLGARPVYDPAAESRGGGAGAARQAGLGRAHGAAAAADPEFGIELMIAGIEALSRSLTLAGRPDRVVAPQRPDPEARR
jgi:AcrR family transcriptional regulator